MNPQYYIKITPEKERELFNFIIKECNGVVFGFSDAYTNENEHICEYVDKNNIESQLYYISYRRLHDNQIINENSLIVDKNDYIIIDEMKFSLKEDAFYAAPYIEYSRFGELNRIWIDYIGIKKDTKQLLSPLYEVIRKWVKKNATEIEKDENLKVYHIK